MAHVLCRHTLMSLHTPMTYSGCFWKPISNLCGCVCFCVKSNHISICHYYILYLKNWYQTVLQLVRIIHHGTTSTDHYCNSKGDLWFQIQNHIYLIPEFNYFLRSSFEFEALTDSENWEVDLLFNHCCFQNEVSNYLWKVNGIKHWASEWLSRTPLLCIMYMLIRFLKHPLHGQL